MAKSTKTAKKTKSAAKNKNIERMVGRGVLDPEAAKRLNPGVVKKVEAMSAKDVNTIIRFKLKVGGAVPWEPDQDGSIF